MTVDLSVVIVSYNVRDMLRDCLQALPEATKGLTTEVFVVDNASADDSVEMVRMEFPDVRLTVSEENLGFARANNAALRQSAGRFLLLLNPDTDAEPESLARLVRFMEAHPKAGACGPKLLNTDGTLQPQGARFPTLLRDFMYVTGLRRLAGAYYERALNYGREDFDVLSQVDALSGACLLVRREVIDQVGLLDERFFMFSEEVEWCHRMKKAGWEVWYVPEARVTHHWMGSVRQVSRQMAGEFFKSKVLYYQITGGPLTALGARMIMVLGLLKNNFIHLGVAAKRGLRRIGLVR